MERIIIIYQRPDVDKFRLFTTTDSDYIILLHKHFK
jgi:hypothetical protein